MTSFILRQQKITCACAPNWWREITDTRGEIKQKYQKSLNNRLWKAERDSKNTHTHARTHTRIRLAYTRNSRHLNDFNINVRFRLFDTFTSILLNENETHKCVHIFMNEKFPTKIIDSMFVAVYDKHIWNFN